jgi:gliding motility-associated lipoprotein GldH
MKIFVKKKCSKYAFVFGIVIYFFGACNQIELFEKNTTIPGLKWHNNFIPTGSFNIVDTTSLYNVFVVIRHTDSYIYNNIWLNIGLQAPGDSIKTQKVNLSLGSDAQGWEGIGMNDIWEVRKPIAQMAFKRGIYTFSIVQIMRDNPLQHIMSAGLRLEKVK